MKAFAWRLNPVADLMSKNFERKHRGTLVDWYHAVVGAYAEIFTCDGSTALDLRGLREAIGRPPAVARPSSDGLAAELNRQLDAALDSRPT